MKHTDPRIEAALRAGGTDKGIARQLCTTHRTVRNARLLHGIPIFKAAGKPLKFASPEDTFRAYSKVLDDGHRVWTGWFNNHGTPYLTWGGRNYTAYRVAFGMRWECGPEGFVLPGCDQPRCVDPEHVEDQRMRDLNRTYQAIFGVAA